MASSSRTVTASDAPPQPALQDEPAKTADTQFREGDVLLAKYRVERVLGQGGMGIVLSVRHMELEELFAMKLLLPQALDNPKAASRFLREARAAARLKGEHAVKVFDVGRLDGDAPYIVMEYLQGSDLKELLVAQGPLPVEEVITYLLQVCEALAEAHGMGIIHRDLKPSNLFLIQRPNGSACVKVIDFGISKVVTQEGGDLTSSGAMVGSPLYMSPEQMMHSKNLDARSDIWAMGVVLYELVTGKVPFEGETFTQIVGRVLNHEPLLPSQVHPDLPEWVDAVVMRCLRKKPEERFQRIDELAAALRSRARVAVGAMTDPALTDTVRAPQRPLSSSDGESVRTALAQSRADETGPSRSRLASRRRTLIGMVAAGIALVTGGAWLLRGPSSHTDMAAPAMDAPAAPAGAVPALAPTAPTLGAVPADPGGVVPSESSVEAAAPSLSGGEPARAAPSGTPSTSGKATPSRSTKPQGKSSVAPAVPVPTPSAAPAPPPPPTSTAQRREGVY
jgi:serine/threonine-protein kinase